MKLLITFSCLLAITAAKPSGIVAPAAYAYAAPAPIALAARGFSYSTTTYAAPAPITVAVAAPAPLALAAPAPAPVAALAAPAAVAAPAPAPLAAPAPAVVAAPAPVAYAAPAVAAAPLAVAAPVVKSQYHAQDELGQASYGHAEPYQAHNAVQDAAGNKIGSYSYVAPNGQVISANYVADALGYRVASNALPVAPAVIGDTSEVQAARASHLAEHAAAKSRSRRSVAVAAYAAPAALPLTHAYAAPIAYTAPAAPFLRPAFLTTTVNTPGHAISYRVD